MTGAGGPGELVSIGQFARFSRLSIKALRLYDELGLLKPRFVDPVSGYRHYALSQLRDAGHARRLRELGVPLAEARVALRLDSPDGWRAVLERHAARLEAEAAEAAGRLAATRALLSGLEPWDAPPAALDVTVRFETAVVYAAIRDSASLEGIGEQVSGLYARLFAALDAAGLRPAGPAFIAYPEEDFNPEAFILDVGVPVPPPLSLAQAALKGSGAFAGLFKPCRAAVARVVGPYSTLTAAHAAVFAWLQERGLTATSAPREVYLIGPGMAEEAAFVTELVYPIGTPPPGR